MTEWYYNIEGVTCEEMVGIELPDELQIDGVNSGGGGPTKFVVETGDKLTGEDWRHRYRCWLDGTPPPPPARVGSPEARLSPEQRDRLERVVSDSSFKKKGHLRHAAAAELSKIAPTRIAACLAAISALGDVSWGKPDPDLGFPRKFYGAVTKVVRMFNAPD